MTKLSKIRRQTIQSIKENFGVAKVVTVDPRFEKGLLTFQAISAEMMELGASAHVYLEQAKVWCTTSAEMSNHLSKYFQDSHSETAAATIRFQKANDEISNVVRKSVACVALEQCLNPLKVFCSERVPDIERKIKIRNDYRVDYDLYTQRWKDLQSIRADRSKMEQTQEKLDRAKSAYESLNAELIMEFDSLQASKESLLHNQATALMICQQQFFQHATDSLNRSLQGLPKCPAKGKTEQAIAQYIRSGGPDASATAKAIGVRRASFEIKGSKGAAASDDSCFDSNLSAADNPTPNPRWSANPMFSNQQLTRTRGMPALPPAPKIPSGKIMAVARYPYEPRETGEVGFVLGDLIEVLEQGDSGWWVGVVKGQKGEFPANYVELK